MRKLCRANLPRVCQTYLAGKQLQVDAGRPLERLWKQSRKTKTMKKVVDTLSEMTGVRCRCMYCEDSRGTTIEHFWPKTRFPEVSFKWLNFLLLCQGCQSHKGDRFAVDVNGNPLLIDPTSEEPWDFLFFDSLTGMITGRYLKNGNSPHPKGEQHDTTRNAAT